MENIEEVRLQQLEFLLLCKAKEFHQAGYQDMTVDILKEYLLTKKWQQFPAFLHEMAEDVLSLTNTEVIDYLRLKDVFYAKEESLHHIFSNLI